MIIWSRSAAYCFLVTIELFIGEFVKWQDIGYMFLILCVRCAMDKWIDEVRKEQAIMFYLPYLMSRNPWLVILLLCDCVVWLCSRFNLYFQ